MASRLLNKRELIEQCEKLQKQLQAYKDKEDKLRELVINVILLICTKDTYIKLDDNTFIDVELEFRRLLQILDGSDE